MMRFQVSRDDVSFTFNFIFSIPISSPCPPQNLYSYRLWQSTSDSMSINGSSFESQLECPHHGSIGDAFVCTVGDEHLDTVKKRITYTVKVLMFFWKGTQSWHNLIVASPTRGSPLKEAKVFRHAPQPHPPDCSPDTHSNITLLRLWMGFRKQLVKTLIATHAQQCYTGEPRPLIFPRFRDELTIATPHGEPPNPTSSWLLAGTKMAAKMPRIAMLHSTLRAASMWTGARTQTASTGYSPARAARTSHLQCQDKPAQTHCATFSAAILHLVSLRTSMVKSHLS
jgi:hypothetical protein